MVNIKAVFLDIDGVIIGTQAGYNFPQPHLDVTRKLIRLNEAKIKVTLCTAKAFFCVKKTIEECELNAYHITDGGAVIYNPFTKEKQILTIEKASSKELLADLLAQNLYTEIYTLDGYFVAKPEDGITEKHTLVLGKEPIITKDLNKIIENDEIVKIMLITRNDEEKAIIKEIGEKYTNQFSLSFGIHPSMLPLEVAWFIAKGVNKKSAVEKVMALENSSPAYSLGVGDSTGDWDFMQLCDYVATLENGSTDLKKLVLSRDKFGHVAPSVEENGLLNIFNYFHI